MNSPVSKITGLFFCLLLAGSWLTIENTDAMGSIPPSERLKNAQQIADNQSMHGERLKTSIFQLQAWTRFKHSGKPLRIYIEGDGFAWRSASKPSWDPTPYDPLPLMLSGLDDSPNVAYLARPCQYVGVNEDARCEERYWTEARFSEEVIVAMNEAMNKLEDLAKAQKIELVGYSGGAAVAFLVAARRSDVISLRTVAGNLDPEAVNRHHHVSPLTDSLDPLNVLEKIKGIPQLHFVGDKDKVVPMDITQHFVSLLGKRACAEIVVNSDATHSHGWKERWQEFLHCPLPCEAT